jgi:hypothetical protein
MKAPTSITGVVGSKHPDENMYGCLPCPKCRSKYRASFRNGRSKGKVACDDCGFEEKATWVGDYAVKEKAR